MRNTVLALLFSAAVLGTASTASAQVIDETTGVGRPMLAADEARDIAAMNGVVAFRRIELDDGVWKIEGRDRSDRRVEMKIDPYSGEIAELERFD